MTNDRQIKISTAGSRKAVKWQTTIMHWSEFVARLATPIRGAETLAEYLRLPKSRQDELKDVGGFVGGALINGLRRAHTVASRDLITLDLDNIPPGETDSVLAKIDALGCAFTVYSTRKHEPYKPRLRVIAPLDRACTSDEYEPIARKLAEFIGIEMCDPSTFEASRLMYWPSCCSDSLYIHTVADKPMLSADGVLALYPDWRDVTCWPQVPGVDVQAQRLAAKQADPEAKRGIVGAFCRTYDVYRVMDVVLPGRYEKSELAPNRYSYMTGSTTGGAVVYSDGKYIFSHHATDPAAGRLCNAFDLMRYHLYGSMDDDVKQDTPINKMPSYIAACKYAVADPEVASLLNRDKYESATADFSVAEVAPEKTDTDWMKTLKLHPQTGVIDKTVDNILIILSHDPLLKDKLAFDEFANRPLAMGALPWNQHEARRAWSDTDDAGMRHYLEKVYGITGKDRIQDALDLEMHRRAFNELRDYLTGLEWDGVHRLDTLLIDYLGASDTRYNRAVIRKALTAAVARVMHPGCKFDIMTIITGPQGIGKSTLLRTLGRKWFSDSLCAFEGKEAYELLRGAWIIEVGELNAMTRSELNDVKQFLSKQEDSYREAYGRRAAVFSRTCVFFGTTNASEFLSDSTGERRFWPVDSAQQPKSKDVFTQLPQEVDMVWAEAMIAWRNGESLILAGEEEAESKRQQEQHRVSNAKEGLVREFLDREVPLDWESRTLDLRRIYWASGSSEDQATRPRDRICAAELWCELFNGDIKYMRRTDSNELVSILSGIEGWQRGGHVVRCGPYGIQKGFTRKSES